MEWKVGTCTFVVTDIEGSTPLWAKYSRAMQEAIPRHNAIARDILAGYGDCLHYKFIGDALFAVFASAETAYHAVRELRLAYDNELWPDAIPLKVRMALHTGDAELRDGDVQGLTPALATRLLSVGYGGQTLVSGTSAGLLTPFLQKGDLLLLLGEYLLRNWGEQAVPIYQLNLAERPSRTFPPLQTQYPNNLPVRLSQFIGKEREQEALLEALRTHRLVTLTGIGGGGKTSLALQLAERLCDRREFKNGVWFVGLDALPPSRSGKTAQVAGIVARKLGLPEEKGHTVHQQLQDYLKTKSLLLVLDNCEHRVEECAILSKSLLSVCPELFVLATSREELGVVGEMVWEVELLSLPPKRPLLPVESLLTYEAICLFQERARLEDRNFVVSPENSASVVNICRALDGIPFAIELAAANVKMLGAKQIEVRLYPLLENHRHTEHDRQKTIWTTLEWSVNLLSESERDLLMRLSVFAGGWTLEAAESVCEGDGVESTQIFRLIQILERKSLVRVEEVRGEEVASEKRYRLLEVVREYAMRRLTEEGQKETFRKRHSAYFLDLAEQTEPELGKANRKIWMDRLDAEQDNLRLTFQNADFVGRLRLAGALWRFWAAGGFLLEAETLLTSALRRQAGADEMLIARAQNGLGAILFLLGKYAEARSQLEQSLETRTSLQDNGGCAETLFHLGNTAVELEDWPVAASCYEQSLQIRRSLHANQGVAAVLNSLGNLFCRQKDWEQAEAFYAESQTLYRRLGDTARCAVLGCNLALVSYGKKEYSTARALYEEHMPLLEKAGNQWELCLSLNNYAEVCYQLVDYATACSSAKRNFELLSGMGSRCGLAYPLETLGKIRKSQGHCAQALLLLAAASALCEAEGEAPPENLENEILLMKSHIESAEWKRLWQQGQTLFPEELSALALETICDIQNL